MASHTRVVSSTVVSREAERAGTFVVGGCVYAGLSFQITESRVNRALIYILTQVVSFLIPVIAYAIECSCEHHIRTILKLIRAF